MNTFAEMVAAVQSDLTVTAFSPLFTPTTIKLALNRAYTKIGATHLWAATRDAVRTSSEKNQEYYDYPQNWQSDSIWKLMVDGTDYDDPLTFKDYLFEQENGYPSGLSKLWASERNRYFITPVPTTDGDNNIAIWGFKTVDPLINDSDITIFSYDMQEVNEAIILEANAILKNKGEILPPFRRGYITGAVLLDALALEIVTASWHSELAMSVKNEKTTPQFDVPDFFAGRNKKKTTIGNF